MTATEPGVRLDIDIPPDFHEVPLDLAVEDRTAAQQELVEALELADAQRREGLGWFLEATARMVRDGPVVATAFCAVEIGGVPSTASLTVATRQMPSDDPLVFAEGAAQSMRRQGDYGSVQIVRFGSVIGGLASREMALDEGRSYQMTAVVPVPGAQLGVFVTVATADHDHLGLYERVVRDAAASVRVVST